MPPCGGDPERNNHQNGDLGVLPERRSKAWLGINLHFGGALKVVTARVCIEPPHIFEAALEGVHCPSLPVRPPGDEVFQFLVAWGGKQVGFQGDKVIEFIEKVFSTIETVGVQCIISPVLLPSADGICQALFGGNPLDLQVDVVLHQPPVKRLHFDEGVFLTPHPSLDR